MHNVSRWTPKSKSKGTNSSIDDEAEDKNYVFSPVEPSVNQHDTSAKETSPAYDTDPVESKKYRKKINRTLNMGLSQIVMINGTTMKYANSYGINTSKNTITMNCYEHNGTSEAKSIPSSIHVMGQDFNVEFKILRKPKI